MNEFDIELGAQPESEAGCRSPHGFGLRVRQLIEVRDVALGLDEGVTGRSRCAMRNVQQVVLVDNRPDQRTLATMLQTDWASRQAHEGIITET